MKFSPYRTANRLVFADKFQPEILTGSPLSGASDKKSGGNKPFLDLYVNI